MNKRGNVIGMIMFFGILLLILIIGFIASISVGVIDIASDEITPIMEDLGVVGATNLSEASEYTFGVVDKGVQSLPWIVGFMYVAALIFSVIFAISYTYNPHPVFIGFYIIMVLLLIFGAIIMSNMYEDIYTSSDDLSDRLHEQTLLSYMILYAPFILSLIALITGIYLFSRPSELGGGYGV